MKNLFLGLSIIFVLLYAGCTNNNPTSPSGNGELKMYMVDSPANFDAVFINVTEVDVHSVTSDSNGGWFVLNNTPRMYNLISLRNGNSTILGDTALAAGHYSQIRLILGAGSQVVVNGIAYSLTVPGGFQTGIKLNCDFDIQANAAYQITLDFNAAKSIIQSGSKYILQPVIRAEANESSGTISGTVLPAASQAVIWTVSNSDTVTAYADAASGFFKLMALPAGSYTLNIQASDTTAFKSTTLNNVVVASGKNTDEGTITLSPK